MDFLIDVVQGLPEEYVLVVAGDGPELQKWKNHVGATRRVAPRERVRFLGRVDRKTLTEWYAATDVFLLASGYEGFPHVVAEAVATGLPCVVSDKGGNPETKELFPQHVTVVRYRDAEAWSCAIRSVPDRLAPLRSKSFEETVGEYIEILKRA